MKVLLRWCPTVIEKDDKKSDSSSPRLSPSNAIVTREAEISEQRQREAIAAEAGTALVPDVARLVHKLLGYQRSQAKRRQSVLALRR